MRVVWFRAGEPVIASVVEKTKAVPISQALQPLIAAHATFGRYLAALNEGRYTEAAQLYGDAYDQLLDYNPGLDPSDKPALLKAGCTVSCRSWICQRSSLKRSAT